MMVCTACEAQHFPRTDPAVIMLVTRDDHALLGHSQRFPRSNMYSTLAGFVEPGETLEEAVRREVFEESGIKVGAVQYHSSQPWPFPGNIMLGFYGEGLSEDITIDPEEMLDVRWFSREQIRDPEAHGFLLPRADSIARRLIEDWMATDERLVFGCCCCSCWPPAAVPRATARRRSASGRRIRIPRCGRAIDADQGDYTQLRTRRVQSDVGKREATQKCLQQKGSGAAGGVEPLRRNWLWRRMRPRLLTIGYEGCTIEDVLAELKAARVGLLIDVRAMPRSRKPGFSKRQLAAGLDEQGIAYVHLQGLGTPKPGRDAVRAGHPERMEPIFREHMTLGPRAGRSWRRRRRWRAKRRVCLLCFEQDPMTAIAASSRR